MRSTLLLLLTPLLLLQALQKWQLGFLVSLCLTDTECQFCCEESSGVGGSDGCTTM